MQEPAQVDRPLVIPPKLIEAGDLLIREGDLDVVLSVGS
jgi:hypothetical protein